MFFDQIKEIDGNIKNVRDDLKKVGVAVDDHFDQLDDIAAHIIALEAIMVQFMKSVELDTDAVKAWIVDATEGSTGKKGGSKKAKMVVEQLLEETKK